MTLRYATVTNGSERSIAALLPDNYKIVGKTIDGPVVIAGRDVAGWTLDDYVIPRLASALCFATEVDTGEVV